MSAIPALTGAIAGATAGGNLGVPTADQPGKDPFSIGNVTFTSRECPTGFPIGAGKQVYVEKQITGGTKITQLFGAFWDNVSFTATFWDLAESRLAAIDAYRQNGTQVVLSWRSFRFNVYVVSVKPTFRNAYRCTVEIELNVLGVAASAPSSSASATSLDSVVGTANGNAATAYASLTASDTTAATTIPAQLFTNLNAALSAATPLAQSVGTTTGTAVLTAVTAAMTAASSYIAATSSTAAGYVPAVSLYNSLALIMRNVQQGQSTNTIQQVGGSYFETAVVQYGSIDAGVALADANNAPSLRVSDYVNATIALPPYPSAA